MFLTAVGIQVNVALAHFHPFQPGLRLTGDQLVVAVEGGATQFGGGLSIQPPAPIHATVDMVVNRIAAAVKVQP